MDLKHRASMIKPFLKDISDPATQDAFIQLLKHLNDMYTNIYDDLIRVAAKKVDDLPTASYENLGRYYLKTNAGADDTLHVCIYDGAASGYKFQQVSLS